MIWGSKPVKLSLAGCGNMGRVHARAVRQNKACTLRSVYDPAGGAAERLANEFGAKAAARSYQELLGDPETEGVILATPHYLHYEQTMQALKAGKHVLVEKPIALNARAAREMCACAKETGRLLLVGQVMRFWPNVARAREAIRANAVGKIRHVIRRRLIYQKDAGRAWAHDPGQSGGWVIHGVAVHEVDALLYMTSLRVTKVSVAAAKANPIWNDIDELSAIFEFEDGAVGSLVMSLNSHFSGLETVLVGEQGSIALREHQCQYAMNGVWENVGNNDGVGDELADFISAIRGAKSRIDVESVLPTMVVLDAMRSSHETGQPVTCSGCAAGSESPQTARQKG